jgi:hypothetical protein
MSSFNLAHIPDFLSSIAFQGEASFSFLYEKIRHSPPYNLIVFYCLLFFIFYRIYGKFSSASCPCLLKASKSPSELLKAIDQSAKELKDAVQGIRPKVPQAKSNSNAIPNKIDGLYDKIKEIQEMQSKFQADVIDAHLSIFNALNNKSDKDYLQLPEKELVEPDSALPPLENEENEDFLIR